MFRVLLLLLLVASCGKPDQAPTDAPGRIFDPTAFGARTAPASGPVAPLEIVDYGPRGQLESAHHSGQVFVRFNRPAVPFGSADSQDSDELTVVDGEGNVVAGRAHWQTPSRLVFEAADALSPARRFEVRYTGERDLKPFVWSFETARPSVALLEPVDGGTLVGRSDLIFLQTTMATDLAELARHVEVTANGDHVTVNFREATPEERDDFYVGAGELIAVGEHAPFGVEAKVKVVVRKGWSSKVGPLTAAGTFEGEFEVHPPARVTAQTCVDTNPCEIQRLVFEFATPVDGEQLRNVRVVPAPPELEITPDWNEPTMGFHVEGRFTPGTPYTVVVDSALVDVFGQNLGADARFGFEFAMPPQELYLSTTAGSIVLDGAAHVGVSTRHIKQVALRVAKVPFERYRELHFSDRWQPNKLPPVETLGPIVEASIDVKPRGPTEWGSTPLSLATLIGDHRGAIVVEARATAGTPGYSDDLDSHRSVGVFVVGSLAPIAFVSTASSAVRVEDLRHEEPREGVDVEIHTADAVHTVGRTDSHGLLRFGELPGRGGRLVVARHTQTNEFGVSPVERAPAARVASWLAPGERVEGALVAERGVYRPGEPLFVAGWGIVQTPHNEWGQRVLPEGARVTIELLDRDDTVLASAKPDVKRGRFWARLAIPQSARLGHATVRATYALNDVEAGDPLQTTVQVKEFRTPQFEVSAKASTSDIIGAAPFVVDLDARYLSGAPAPIRSTRARQSCWQVAAPRVEGWAIGVEPDYYGGIVGQAPVAQKTGENRARIATGSLVAGDGSTRLCSLSATVQNAAYQEEGAAVEVTVHPSDLYLGVRAIGRDFVAGSRLKIEPKLFTTTGAPARGTADRAEFTLTRHVSEPVYARRGRNAWVSRYEEREVVVKKCVLATDKSCTTGKLQEGYYVLEGTSLTDERRRFRADVRVSKRSHAASFIELQLPRGELAALEPVDVTIKSAARHGTLVLQRPGILKLLPFRTRRGEATVTLKPGATWAPRVNVEAWAVNRTQPVPRFERDAGSLRFDPGARELDVQVTAPAGAGIRETVMVTVEAGSGTMPVDGKAVVWAVDDAILALTNYEVPDLSQLMYPWLRSDMTVYEILSSSLPKFVPERYDPYAAYGYGFGSGSGFGSGGGGIAGGPPSPRADFRATPLFVGDIDIVDGKGTVEFKLPDSITRFRVLAAVSSDVGAEKLPVRFGSATTTITVSAPLVVRPALPRFVRPGDVTELAALVQNASGQAGSLAVRFELAGDSIEWVTAVTPSSRHEMGADEELRVGFLARVVSPGETAVTVHTTLTPGGGGSPIHDAVRLVLTSSPEPTLTQTVATYGVLDDQSDASLAVLPPRAVRADVGGVSVALTSTILGGLKDATRELINYPYGCAEQTASRMLPLVALAGLREVAPPPELPDAMSVSQFVRVGVTRLLSMQQPDGGFGYWPGSGTSHPYVSAYVTWVLQQARDAGEPVPDIAYIHALDYLETVTNAPAEDLSDAMIYFADLRRAIAVHVLARAGRSTDAAITRLLEKELPVFARAFVITALAESRPNDKRLGPLAQQLANTLVETAGTASVVESPRFDLGPVFHSDLRSSAIAAIALTRVEPNHPAIPKLIRGLMQSRYGGAWRNTQENAYALVALADYAQKFEKDVPNFAIEVAVDNAVLVSDRWVGRSAKERVGRLPMAALQTIAAHSGAPTVPLRIRKQGTGRAYYRLAMTYAPVGPTVAAIARGIDVTRVFRRESGTASAEPPSEVAAGEVIAVDIEIANAAHLRYVAVNAPLPAGFEAIDLSLGSAKTLPMGGARGWWLSHHEYHDDRVFLFADDLPPGKHRHTLYVRATTPGTFSFPPTRAEAMYTPEVFGHTAGAPIIIR